MNADEPGSQPHGATLATAAEAAAPPFPEPLLSTAPRRSLWHALNSRPGAGAQELAGASGVSQSYAVKTLRQWELAGCVACEGGGPGQGKTSRWRPLTANAPGAVEHGLGHRAEPITYPFPLSSGVMGYFVSPLDLTSGDVERLIRFLKSLVIHDWDPAAPQESAESSV